MKSKEQLAALFSRQAEPYRKRLEEIMSQHQAAGRERVLEFISARPGMRVLDLACGPGTLTFRLARQLEGRGEVVGVDLADGMIELARRQLAGRSLPVQFQRMDIEQLNFPSASFDAVACGHGLQLTPNLGRALLEAHRVLKPRGPFGASLPVDPPEPAPAAAAFAAALDARLGAWEPPGDLDATRAIAGDAERLRSAGVAAGFREVEVEQLTAELAWEGPGQFATSQLEWWSQADRIRDFSRHVKSLIAKETEAAVARVTGPGPFSTLSASLVLTARA